MRRFKFRLEPLKRLRQHEERTAQLELAREIQALSRLGGARAETIRELSRIDGLISSGTSVRDLQSTVISYRVTSEHLSQLEALIKTQEQRLEAARSRYFEARRQTQTMERLEDKERARYQAEMLHEEQQVIDELAVSRSTR